MSTGKTIKSIADFEATISGKSKVIVKFETRACVICRRLEPGLKAVVERNADQLNVVQVDADELLPIAERYGVRGVPTLVLFENGEEISRVNGFQSASMLNQWLAPHL